MSDPNVLLAVSDGVATITVNRPDKLNALSAATIKELAGAFASCRDNPEVRAVVLTGAGDKAFVAGADIRELVGHDAQAGAETARRGQDLTLLIESLGKPVVAAINGFCLGGGCEMAMACTIRLASDKAKLGQPEVKIGVLPGYGGTVRLPRLVGKGRALELILTGEPIDAAEALRIGLVNKVVPHDQLQTAARDLAKKIAANAPLAVRYSLQSVNHGMEMVLKEALAYEASLFGLCCGTKDKNEGMNAFLEKRPPAWKNA